MKIIMIWGLMLLSCNNKERALEKQTLELAYIIAAECMECDSVERLLVGSTVINRVLHPDFPKSIEEVIKQDNQFLGYCAEWYVYDKGCYEIAKYLISGGKRDEDILYFFKKRKVTPKHVSKILYNKKYHSFGI